MSGGFWWFLRDGRTGVGCAQPDSAAGLTFNARSSRRLCFSAAQRVDLRLSPDASCCSCVAVGRVKSRAACCDQTEDEP